VFPHFCYSLCPSCHGSQDPEAGRVQGGRLGEQLAEAGDATSLTDILGQPVVVVRTREIR